MEQCSQTETQTIYQHGLSVRDHLKQIINYLSGIDNLFGWRLPDWLLEEKQLIVSHVFDWELLETYAVYHDCGKPFCQQIDSQGKRHFPQHAEVSERMWLAQGGDPRIGRLIGMDLDIHLLKDKQVPEFATRPEAVSLLLAGLAEIHANSELFGGLDTISFKSKFRQIERRGRAVLLAIDGTGRTRPMRST